MDIVLSDGQCVTATPLGEHSDLFWALQGGGGNYGVVLRFEFEAYALPNNSKEGQVLVGRFVFPLNHPRAWSAYKSFLDNCNASSFTSAPVGTDSYDLSATCLLSRSDIYFIVTNLNPQRETGSKRWDTTAFRPFLEAAPAESYLDYLTLPVLNSLHDTGNAPGQNV